MVAKIATRISTEMYLRAWNSFLKLIMSIRKASPNIVPDLISHISPEYSSKFPDLSFGRG